MSMFYSKRSFRWFTCFAIALGIFVLPVAPSESAPETREIVKPSTRVPPGVKTAQAQPRVFDKNVEISDVIFLAAPSAKELEGLDPEPEEKGALRIGIVRPLPEPYTVASKTRPIWNTLRDASKVWAVIIRSEAAEGIRINLENIRLPKGAQLVVTSMSDPNEMVGPYGFKEVLVSKSFWTETIFSDAVILECQLPPFADEDEVSFEITGVAHMYVPFSELIPQAKVGNCHNDVTCAEADWRLVGNGVAGIGSIGSAGFLWCTGTLLNNTAEDFTDYFLTANHCVRNQTEANSTEYYWFYQTATCNGIAPNPASVPRTGGGSVFLAGRTRSQGTDFSLLRLRNATPDGVAYVGWTATAPDVGNTIRGIHHPDGSFKRISYGSITAQLLNYWRVVWSSGVTEPGSSGGPLFNSSRQVVGQLWGGSSSCSRPTLPDEYGRFDKTFPFVSQWLEPVPTGPANDNFANATGISGLSGQVAGSNVGATKEAGEPNHAGNAGGRSVWWRWTAPASGQVTIDTFGSNFDTLLAAYTGNSVGGLTLIAANDDTGGLQSQIAFEAVVGTVYRIAVDGYNAASGNIVLNWLSAGTPPAGGIKINCGGMAVETWEADRGFFGFSRMRRMRLTVQNAGDVPQAVLQSSRFVPARRVLEYSFADVASGSYLVRLHFADPFSFRAGMYTFNVDIEGERVLTGFDVFAAAGARNSATVREFNVEVDGNGLQLTFTPVMRMAFINGIEIIPLDKSRSPADSKSKGAVAPSEVWVSGSRDDQHGPWKAVDGDLSTAWIGDPGAESWWFALGYPRLIYVKGVRVSHAGDSLTNMVFIGSRDGRTWFDLGEVLADRPDWIRYLWIQFTPGDGEKNLVPKIREIEVETRSGW